MKTRCGLLGEHLGHSYSPQLHRLLGTYPYELCETAPEGIGAILADRSFTGFNVTIPYKRTVIPFMDELGPAARATGSVNTIVRRNDGSLFGDNTDVYGFGSMLDKSGVDVRGKKTLVLGSGGAASAVCEALKSRSAQIVTVSRSGENNYQNLHLHADAQIIVNATPVGMYPNNGVSPLDISAFPKLGGVFDLIYNPARTRLIQDAKERGIPCESGLYMLVSQAARSSELFTGAPIGQAQVDRAYKTLLIDMQNIVLIGMPGCGKSTAARALSRLTGRPLIDCDEEIEKQTGMSPASIITSQGEAAFRRIETDVLRELGKRSGWIIASGGGAVTREENYPLLGQNGVIVYLRRPLEKLPLEGRPLSAREGLKALYEQRKGLYEHFADRTVDADDDADKTAEKIRNTVYGS